MEKESRELFFDILELYMRSGYKISSDAVREIKFSILSGNYHLIYGRFKEPIGFFIWANVTRESLVKLKKYNMRPKYCYEWSEGPYMLILNIISTESLTLNIRNTLVETIRKNKLVAYSKNGNFKIWLRHNRRFYKVSVLKDAK